MDRRLHLLRDFRATGVVVVADWFLDPVQAFIVQCASAQNGFIHGLALVEISHERDVVADALLHIAHGGKVFLEFRPADPQLHGAVAALRDQLRRFVSEQGRILDPQSATVVGPHGPDFAAERANQRHTQTLGVSIPCRHVDTGERESDQPGGVEQREAFA